MNSLLKQCSNAGITALLLLCLGCDSAPTDAPAKSAAEASPLNATSVLDEEETTDCNNMQGGYELTDKRISFAAMISTRMFCDGSQEQLFAGMLDNVSSYFFDSRGQFILELKYDSGSMIFR